MSTYHSHIFANGETVTHTHSYQDCRKNSTNGSQEEPKEQVVIYYGLSLNLDDTVSKSDYLKFCPTYFTQVVFPEIEMYTAGCFSEKAGRAPPVASL